MSEKQPFTPDFSKFSQERVEGLERITGPPAIQLLKQAHLLPHVPANTVLLDNACGAGVLTATLFNALEKDGESLANVQVGGLKIVCGDVEPKMVDNVSERIKARGWEKIVESQLVDAQKPAFPDEHFTHVLMNFGPQVIPDPDLMCRETLRIIRPSGIAGFTSWSKISWLPSIQALFPSFVVPLALSEKWSDAKVVAQKMNELGFRDVLVTEYAFEVKVKVTTFVDVMESAIPILKEEGKREQYLGYLTERADGEGEMEMIREALVITGKK